MTSEREAARRLPGKSEAKLRRILYRERLVEAGYSFKPKPKPAKPSETTKRGEEQFLLWQL